MNKPQDPEAAEPVQTTNVPAVDLPRIVRLSVGDIVTVPIKNRWGIGCAATIEAVHAETVDATVWNMDGPGADRLITGIPHSVCEPNVKGHAPTGDTNNQTDTDQ